MQDPAEEKTAFERLVRQYARLIRSVVLRVAGTDADLVAEDAEQRVLVNLWKAAEGEQEIRHPCSYVYRVAVRETLRAIREEHRRRERTEAMASVEPAGTRTPEEIAASRELGRIIAEALDGLSANRSKAVRAHLAGFSVAEIMAMFGWSYNTARNLISRGMADLRRALRARGVHD